MNEAQFRYSLRPSQEIPVPRLLVSSVMLVDDTKLTTLTPRTRAQSAESRTKPTPPEFHLRNFSKPELSDPQSLLAFVEEFGIPEHAIASTRLVSGLREDRVDLPIPSVDLEDGEVSLRSVAHAVWLMRLLVEHADAAFAGRKVGPIWQRAGAFELDDLGDVLHGDLMDLSGPDALETVGWQMFADILNHALKHVTPRVIVTARDEHMSSDPFSAAAAQLYNDLIEGLPYSYCADETCGQRFKRQVGRAAKGGSRRDAQFCMPQHARSQSQRDRRRAERAERAREAARGE